MIQTVNKIMSQFILIVENGLLDQGKVSKVLQKSGYAVRFTSDAETALMILIETRPCLILVNLILPRMDSCTFTRILKQDEDTGSITIVVLLDSDLDIKRMTYCGFDSFINIQEGENSLVREVRKILKKK